MQFAHHIQAKNMCTCMGDYNLSSPVYASLVGVDVVSRGSMAENFGYSYNELFMRF